MLTVYETNIPDSKRTPSSGIVISLVAVALATVPSLNVLEPSGDVVTKSSMPAVPLQTTLIPLNLDLPANITSAQLAACPIETFAAGCAEAAAAVHGNHREDGQQR